MGESCDMIFENKDCIKLNNANRYNEKRYYNGIYNSCPSSDNYLSGVA